MVIITTVFLGIFLGVEFNFMFTAFITVGIVSGHFTGIQATVTGKKVPAKRKKSWGGPPSYWWLKGELGIRQTVKTQQGWEQTCHFGRRLQLMFQLCVAVFWFLTLGRWWKVSFSLLCSGSNTTLHLPHANLTSPISSSHAKPERQLPSFLKTHNLFKHVKPPNEAVSHTTRRRFCCLPAFKWTSRVSKLFYKINSTTNHVRGGGIVFMFLVIPI